ncbi:aromatic ring-hydroxylating dioxygenase subunit alpha [Flavihumibacter sediminis]|nr:aromatic ring-hydroxylating dioxygenase subunit alpha [Flavihumibacter sediminis]
MPQFSVDPDIAKAKTISKDFYINPRHFEDARELIFAPTWQFIGTTDLVKEPGDCYPITLLNGYLNEPLLLTRDKDGQLHCLSNVCTHRGNLMVYEPCRNNQLRCKYHGRLFDLDGQFRSMPEFKEVENFPSEEDNLKQLPLFQWGKLLFTSLQGARKAGTESIDENNPTPTAIPEAIPAVTMFSEMINRVGWLPMDKIQYRPDLSSDYMVKANWALYCENYLEGFHIPFVHASLNAVLDFGEYTTEVYKYSNLQLGIGKKGDSCFDLPANSPDFGKQVSAYYFWVFPNMMFNFYPWGLSFNLVQPLGVDTCKVSFLSFVYDESKIGTGAGSGLDTVEHEDEEVVQMVQKGIRSRFYEHGRYSVKHEKGTHHFHSLIASFMR